MAPTTHPAIDAVATLIADWHVDRAEERRLLELLAACSGEELDAVIASVDVGAMLSAVDDRPLGPDHRTALLRLLTEERIHDLGATARAALVLALSRGRTGSADERALGDLFLATRGADLVALKEAVDGSDDYHDLVELLFHDIDDEAVRTAILGHLAAEALVAGATGETGGPHVSLSPRRLKVLSDIDDTLYANWKDKRYPGKTVYPGVRQLYAELSGSPLEPAGAVVTFVTARPGDRLGLVEGATRRSLAERGLPRARVLAGAFTRLVGNDLIAEEKLANFERYRRVFPECRFVFFGDSGQGDVVFGEQMRALAPDAVPVVLIHDVVATPEERRRELGARGVFLCDSYVGAAVVAFEAGLIDAAGLGRVIAAAERELATVEFGSDAEREGRVGDLARDAACARALLDRADPG